MKTAIIIPARYASTRLPGKPLAPIKGKAMLQRVVEIATSVDGVDEVCVAVDDARIEDFAKSLGVTVIMTDPKIPNGTERCLAAAEKMEHTPDLIMNLQGDAPLTPPHVIKALLESMKENSDWDIGTPAVELNYEERARFIESKKITPHTGTTVVFDPDYKALYFSKNVIPAIRKEGAVDAPSHTFRHVGLYAYRLDALRRYVSLPESTLENLEKLEQLRALENGMAIHIVPVDYQGREHLGVDSPEDLERAEAIIERYGELL